MRRSRLLPLIGGLVIAAFAFPVRAQQDIADVQNTFTGPTGGMRIIDAGSDEKGTFRLALNTEFFIIRDYFVSGDQAHAFAGNLSLSITPARFLEVFASAEVTSAWDDSNDPLLIQRVADVYVGLKGFGRATSWIAVGGDFAMLFPGGVGDASATFRATSFGFRGNLSIDLREHAGREAPLIWRFTTRYWFDNTANLTKGIEDQRFDALGGVVPKPLETRHLLTAFERFAYGVNRVDTVRLATGFEVPLDVRRVGLHPMLEWQWDIPVNRQGYVCPIVPGNDGCLEQEKLKAFPMLITLGMRILSPPKGLSFTVGADVGITGTRTFVRELAPNVPYNVILGVGYAFDPTPPAPPPSEPIAKPVVEETGTVSGRIIDQATGEPISGANVAVLGEKASAQVTDEAGRFTSYGLPLGEVTLEVSHPAYATARCVAVVPSETECTLMRVVVDGSLRIATVDRNGNPVPQLVVHIRGPSEHQVISDRGGFASVGSLTPGAYTAYVDDPAYLVSVRDFDVVEREQTDVQLRILRKPSRPRVLVKETELVLRRQISFATGSDEILPNSELLLLEVADALLRNPGIEVVEIQGHTDNSGEPRLNQRLSQRRAESVGRWLVQHGVEPARLVAKGFGATRPIAPNITAYNRARNRRVQFKIVRRAVANDDAKP
jgi:outer membrane protein OmpA-like peptidoglycan-associated protein